jgi:3',5'-nucleoside bisphosphate phosphatase
MPAVYDLHTHSTASDGAYRPSELVRHAAAAGMTHLALTDHDSLDGLAEARAAAAACGITLIPAVEMSVTWCDKSLHIVGLNIDVNSAMLNEGLARLQAVRRERAQEMGRRLAKLGICGAFEAARTLAGDGMITRTHFARHLMDLGLAPTLKHVFERYLGQGKPGYVPTQWTSLGDSLAMIHAAGGTAVVAHPQRYKLTASWMRRLLTEFKSFGGEAIEVVSGTSSDSDIQTLARYCRQFRLAASVGSDFHSPEFSWIQLGKLLPLPADLTPVWRGWNG